MGIIWLASDPDRQPYQPRHRAPRRRCRRYDRLMSTGWCVMLAAGAMIAAAFIAPPGQL
jgi:hypothetical protein